MKLKFFNLITVFLASSGLLAPAQVAFSRSLPEETSETQHLVCVKQEQHFLCDVESEKRDRSGVQNQGGVVEAKAAQSHKSATDTVASQVISPAQQETIANILIWLIYLVLPCGLGLGIFCYNRYRVYRDAVIEEQIELLERLWQYGSDNDAATDKSTRS